MMNRRFLYYNISDTLHSLELQKTAYDNSMNEELADGVEEFLNSLKEDTDLKGDLPVRLVCIQGDAGRVPLLLHCTNIYSRFLLL